MASGSPSQRTGRTARVLGGMLLASVLLHGALIAFALSRPRDPPRLRTEKPLEVTVVEVVRTPPAQPTPPPDAVETHTPAPVKPPPVVRTPPKPPPQQQRAQPLNVAEPPREEPSPESDVPRLSEGPSPPADAPRAAPPNLLPRPGSPLALVPEGTDSSFGVDEDQAKGGGLRAPEIPRDLAAHIAQDAVGKAKVKRGLVHPYYADLGKAMLKHWDADRAVSQKGLRGFSQNFRENSQLGMKLWQENAEKFGQSGSPLAEGEDDAPRMPERVSAGVDETLSRRQALKRQNRQEWRSTRRAEIRVVQDATGKIIRAELLKPSRDPYVDKEAVKDVRAAAETMPPPPAEVLNGRTELVSHWLFELIVSINPPVPTFSFEFDEALGYIDPRLPLDRRIYKRVRLLAVD